MRTTREGRRRPGGRATGQAASAHARHPAAAAWARCCQAAADHGRPPWLNRPADEVLLRGSVCWRAGPSWNIPACSEAPSTRPAGPLPAPAALDPPPPTPHGHTGNE